MKSDTAFPSLVSLLFLAALILLLAFCAGCADYPITLSVHSDYGKASYSSKGGLEIIVEK